jgi:hypothetical protein
MFCVLLLSPIYQVGIAAHLIPLLKFEVVTEQPRYNHGAFSSSHVLDLLVDPSYKGFWQSHQRPRIVRNEDIDDVLFTAYKSDLPEHQSTGHLISLKLA